MPWMLPTILRNGLASPATRRYPYEKREPFAGARGQLLIDRANCVYCTACARRCPTGALKVDRQKKEMVFLPYQCIVCGACAEVCPKKSLTISSTHKTPGYTKERLVFNG